MAANEEANECVIVKMSESFTEQAGQVRHTHTHTFHASNFLEKNTFRIRITTQYAVLVIATIKLACF